MRFGDHGGGHGGGFGGGFGGGPDHGDHGDHGPDHGDHGDHGPPDGTGHGPDHGPHDDDVAEGPFRVVRPADLLLLDIGLVNLRFDGRRLVRRDPAAPALILVGLPPQHVREEVPPPLDTVPGTLPPMGAFAADASRLVFSIPPTLDGLDLTLESLLTWQPLVPMSVPEGLQVPDDPGTTVFQGIPRSVIEFPAQLLLTYDEAVHWLAARSPQLAGNRAAVWHARLRGQRDGDILLRAVATATGRQAPFARSPLQDTVLADLVTLTSRAELPLPPGSTPLAVPSAPLHAEQLLVTPMGCSAHLHGNWDAPPEGDRARYQQAGRHFPTLAAYDHITGLGRDQYIRVVTRGRLSPGHESLDVWEARRVFVARPDDGIVAYLQVEEHIVLKQPEVAYAPDDGFVHAGREMPFRSLRITDRVTPPIQSHRPKPGDGPGPPPKAFWVQLRDSGKDFEFSLIGTDAEGRKVSFTMPLVFVPDDVQDPDGQVRDLYRPPAGLTPDPAAAALLEQRTRRPLGGQVMAMAEAPDGAAGSTSHAVTALTFGFGPLGGGPGRTLGLPHVAGAAVRVPALEQFTPHGGDQEVVFNPTYLQQSMAKHPAGGYLDLVQPVALAFAAEQAGGLARPDAAVRTLTSQAGVVPDIFATDAATGEVTGAADLADIQKAFGEAKLLGFIDLKKFLMALTKDHLDTLRQLDDQRIEDILGAPGGVLPAPVLRIRDTPGGRELRYVWKPALAQPMKDGQKDPTELLDVTGAALVLDARTVLAPDAAARTTVDGKLTNFALDFAGIAQVNFRELHFTTGAGAKPQVTADGVELTFSNELEFINTLRSALPADVFGTGAFLDVQPTGIRAGYSLALPAIGLGVFTLSNVALSAALTIPFDNRPVSFRFAVSEREHPFDVTVSALGGGGYFALQVGTDGVEEIEGALEFGGSVALNLGVASGGVSIMAGIRFSYADAAMSLAGYLRCNGFLSVLGIVTVSVEFYLELGYEKHGHESVIRGRGTLTVSVRIAFFSKSVSLTLERSFSGAPGDPSFAACVAPEHWRTYCAAFAPLPSGVGHGG
ncbi:hypothetical protein ADL22_11135 [Streptomyces sp. NRRL F-4489]|uniref:hypothetical protein n=1 Tax=Streptomyces sp. NRRL F-4489 TaxID=1609095 RepID=UPI000747C773|nr:hypothetical protein [Streptomyces sp. NRRL F-4489]KUL46058.1 hypothetical protein ADL22_11135 [Streptomyces sp. NRRL F-4489]